MPNDADSYNIVPNAPIGICILHADTLYAEIANDKFLEVAGKPREDIEGKFYWDAFAEVRDYYEQALNDVVRNGVAYHADEVEMTLIRHGKPEMVYVTFVYSPIKDEFGKVTKVSVWVLENTAQVIARQKIEIANEELEKADKDLRKLFHQLEESEIALRLALGAANFGTWYIQSVTREFITDARLKELFGYHPDEDLSIEGALAQITDEYREFVSNTLENAIYKGGDYDVTYSVVGLHDNRLRWLRAIGNLKADPSGEFSAFTGVVMDITEQKQDEIRKNDFIGMVSHELKTPLTSLSAIIQVAGKKLLNSQDQFLISAMDKAMVQLKRMSGMINSFLNISRLESGKMLMDKKLFDLEKLILEIIDEAMLTTSTHIIDFKKCGPIEVSADRDKINSVISNLISNAIKYSPQGKEVHVNCLVSDNMVTVSVHDEGMGVKPQDMDKIFDRYYRVQSNYTQNISGFGIGLYLSAEIIKRHHGQIWLQSESGVGSTFYFTLPLKSDI
jgi:two-component system sensor histidine kinase VicK